MTCTNSTCNTKLTGRQKKFCSNGCALEFMNGPPIEAHPCLQCQKITKNSKFCSRSCSASHTNSRVIRRKRNPDNYCSNCKKQNRRKDNSAGLCTTCDPNYKIVDWSAITIGNCRKRRGELGTESTHADVRVNARTTVLKAYPDDIRCWACSWDSHVHCAHQTPMANFDDNTPISVVNDISNLYLLCPNCHWLADNTDDFIWPDRPA